MDGKVLLRFLVVGTALSFILALLPAPAVVAQSPAPATAPPGPVPIVEGQPGASGLFPVSGAREITKVQSSNPDVKVEAENAALQRSIGF